MGQSDREKLQWCLGVGASRTLLPSPAFLQRSERMTPIKENKVELSSL